MCIRALKSTRFNVHCFWSMKSAASLTWSNIYFFPFFKDFKEYLLYALCIGVSEIWIMFFTYLALFFLGAAFLKANFLLRSEFFNINIWSILYLVNEVLDLVTALLSYVNPLLHVMNRTITIMKFNVSLIFIDFHFKVMNGPWNIELP